MFTHGLYGRLREQAGHHWRDYLQHEFVLKIGEGSLPESAFRHYLIQDYLFLLHFARAHGLLISKLTRLPEMRAAATAMHAILGELPLHVAYCRNWGISEAQIAATAEDPATVNYTRYVLDIGHAGDSLDLMVALAPCIAGYAEIGLNLLNSPTTRLEGNPYGPWIRNYGNPDYLQGVQKALNLLETLSHQRAGQQRTAQLSDIFITATRLESAFWQMGLDVTQAPQ